jgi:signal transduction histidine kinase
MAYGKRTVKLTTFRARVFWSLVPIFFLLFLLLGFVDLYQQKQVAEEEVNRRANAMAQDLAYSSRLAVLTGDRALLESVLQSVTGAVDFAYVWIYGDRWTPLVSTGAKHITLTSMRSNLVEDETRRLAKEGAILSKSFADANERYIEYIVPVTSSQSKLPYELQIEAGAPSRAGAEPNRQQTIGAVRLGLSMNRVEAQLASFLKWRAWSIVAFLCLSALAIYILSGRITRPINQLTEQAKKISQGLLEQTIVVESHDEIGQLATTFNDMARALNEQYLGLEQKVAERTDALRGANKKLAEASEHKSRFLANVNHELRTPLSSIIGYARLMRRETEGQISSLQRENLEDLLRNAERLLRLIDSLLDLAKIEAGKMEVQLGPVAIDELVQSAVTTIEPMLNKETVRLVRNVPANMAPLYTDREKLRQIILNLLGNAVKFTDRGEIKISACQENGNFKLAVADSGIGIDETDMDRIFEEFDRGRLTSDDGYRGTGLGLAIVKRLVNFLGGSVAVESEVGNGSTFTVTLPFNRRENNSI